MGQVISQLTDYLLLVHGPEKHLPSILCNTLLTMNGEEAPSTGTDLNKQDFNFNLILEILTFPASEPMVKKVKKK